jgi:hypothetical protein
VASGQACRVCARPWSPFFYLKPPVISSDFRQHSQLRQSGVEIDQLINIGSKCLSAFDVYKGEDGGSYENYEFQNIVRGRRRRFVVRRGLDLIAIAGIGAGFREETGSGRHR